MQTTAVYMHALRKRVPALTACMCVCMLECMHACMYALMLLCKHMFIAFFTIPTRYSTLYVEVLRGGSVTPYLPVGVTRIPVCRMRIHMHVLRKQYEVL